MTFGRSNCTKLVRVYIARTTGLKKGWIEEILLRLSTTKSNKIPMSLIDDVIDRLQRSKIFTTVGMMNGFLYVPIDKDSREFTECVTHNRQFEFRMSSCVLSIRFSSPNKAYSKSDNCRITALEIMMSAASKAGLRIKWEKAQILKSRTNFLGYTIENGIISTRKLKLSLTIRFLKAGKLYGGI